MLPFVTLNWKPFDNHVRGLVTHKTNVSKPSQKPLKKTFRNLSKGFRVYWVSIKINLELGITQFTLLEITFSTEIKDMEQLNISPVLNIISSEIYRWRRRQLTPIGKIAVIKTLFLSKLNHILVILPNLSSNLIKKIERLFYGYLWDNKPDKTSDRT